ncbi:MAG: hypothetical protein QOI95_3942 [Acidimicrobiaceae bacterium]|jgi:hypothetical protein
MPQTVPQDAVRVDLADLPVVVRPPLLSFSVVVAAVVTDYRGFVCQFAVAPLMSEWSRGKRKDEPPRLTAVIYDGSGRQYTCKGETRIAAFPVMHGEWSFEPALDSDADHIFMAIADDAPPWRTLDESDLATAASTGFEMLNGVLAAMEQRHEILDIVYHSKSAKEAMKSLAAMGISSDVAAMLTSSPLTLFSEDSRNDLARGRDFAARDLARTRKRSGGQPRTT